MPTLGKGAVSTIIAADSLLVSMQREHNSVRPKQRKHNTLAVIQLSRLRFKKQQLRSLLNTHLDLGSLTHQHRLRASDLSPGPLTRPMANSPSFRESRRTVVVHPS
eukprot:751296-Hanusia_phi.AAC.1